MKGNYLKRKTMRQVERVKKCAFQNGRLMSFFRRNHQHNRGELNNVMAILAPAVRAARIEALASVIERAKIGPNDTENQSMHVLIKWMRHHRSVLCTLII